MESFLKLYTHLSTMTSDEIFFSLPYVKPEFYNSTQSGLTYELQK